MTSTKDPSNSMKQIKDYVFTSDCLRDREVVDTSPRRCKLRTPSTGIHTHKLQSVLGPNFKNTLKIQSHYFFYNSFSEEDDNYLKRE